MSTTRELSTISIARPAGPAWHCSRGAHVQPGGGVRFEVWAPAQPELRLEVLGSHAGLYEMERQSDGVYTLLVGDVGAGTDYWLVTAEGDRRPDPVSRFQPHGVHGPSRVVDPSLFHWTDEGWRGLRLSEHVIYELHVGTFSPEGTFDGVAARLPHLKDLGVTAIELMPVAAFPGSRNWGYDGVSLYAPHVAYGGPEGLRRLVDACHNLGMALMLDVVYNHLGPEGNYLRELGPYFSAHYHTPWGDAVNYDGRDSDDVRRFIVENALYWIHDFHIDGLRLDAVHGIYDFSARHILSEIADSCHSLAKALDRRVNVIAESDLNDSRLLRPHQQGGYDIDAQWSDDFHHSLAVLLADRRRGYLSDFGRVSDLKKAITEGFVYDGRRSNYRRRRHGNGAGDLPGEQFVVYTQNHDQIANCFGGLRLGTLVSLEEQKLAAMVLFASPSIPMLFMGQEFGATTPFLYFTDHGDPQLARAVSEGRRLEYLDLAEPDAPWEDPQDARTRDQSRLDWSCLQQPVHNELLTFHRRLIDLRRTTPALANCRRDLTRAQADDAGGTLIVVRTDPGGGAALLLANFSRDRRELSVPPGHAWQLALTSDAPAAAPSAPEETVIVVPPRSGCLYLASA